MNRFLICTASALILVAAACSSPSQPVTVQCPADSTCDVNVTPPPMTSAEIQYHAQQNDLAEDVLVALMIQDMTWRNCWDCYGSYYSRYPTLSTQRNYYYSMPPSQRATTVQQNNTTVIQKNTTVIQQASAKAPASVKVAPASVSGQSSGTGGGNSATNKAPASNSSTSNTTKPSAPAPAPAPARPAPAAPPAPARR